jgi:quercetin dioxygenase-like cupin family protein
MFDDRNTFWFPFPGFAGFEVAINRLDPEQGLADFLIKFEPNTPIHLHRHMAETSTFVMQGEHRVYEPHGTLQDVRPVGSYTLTPLGAPPHREGAGDEQCIVHYYIRSDQDLIFEFLNDDLSLLAPLTISTTVGVWEQARSAAVPA